MSYATEVGDASGPRLARHGTLPLPPGILAEADLAQHLAHLANLPVHQLKVALGKSGPVCKSALYWAEKRGNAQRLRTVAKLLHSAGDDAAAVGFLENAKSIVPQDQTIAVLLSEILSSREEWWAAYQAVAPFADKPEAEARTLVATAQLSRRAGSLERCLFLYERAAQKDQKYRAEYVRMLATLERRDLVIAEADRILAESPQNPALCLALFAALLKTGGDDERAMKARQLVLRSAEDLPDGAIWRARLRKIEGDIDGGFAELTRIPASECDSKLVIERAKFVLERGTWGRDAEYLLAARNVASAEAPLIGKIDLVDGFLEACGGSLEKAAKDPPAFASIKSPESVYEYIISELRSAPKSRGTGLVTMVPSLACGGAERVVANAVRSFARDQRFASTKLYALDISASDGRDFYLQDTGLSRSDITLIGDDDRLERPWAWLGGTLGPRAQAVHRLLLQDRPGIVHSTLDYMNLPAGLAALAAGVPHIVLHVHNMAPRDIAPSKADTFRLLYRTLLQRPEVSLVACGRICLEDYADWLALPDTSRFHLVRNGTEVNRIALESSKSARRECRNGLGLKQDATVIGTAFRFIDLKQPFLWVDAAEKVLSCEPDCKFVMFGDGELHGAVRDYIGARNLESHFVLPGQVKNIYEYLSVLDLFVLSSRTEALPNSLIEAQAAGVPVIAFDVGGVRETMIDSVTGWLVREQSAHALADRIVAGVRDRIWRSAAAGAAQDFVMKNFSNNRMIKMLSSILLGPVGAGKAPA